jgi:hypothetical protein
MDRSGAAHGGSRYQIEEHVDERAALERFLPILTQAEVFHFPKSKLSCYDYRSAPVDDVIFDVAVVRFDRRQPTQIDQAVVSAAIDIAGGVFAAVAGNNLADQLEIFI